MRTVGKARLKGDFLCGFGAGAQQQAALINAQLIEIPRKADPQLFKTARCNKLDSDKTALPVLLIADAQHNGFAHIAAAH